MSIFPRTAAALAAAAVAAGAPALAQQPTPPVPAPAPQAPPPTPDAAPPADAAPATPATPGATAAAPATPPPGIDECAVCHGMTKDAPPSIGPNLWGVGGRTAGSTDYPYSPAMKAYAKSWTPETLVPFIQSPMQAVPGTSMTYPGQPDPAMAKAIADYLMTLKD
jgi:cytochrome c